MAETPDHSDEQQSSWRPMIAIALSMVMMYITSFGIQSQANFHGVAFDLLFDKRQSFVLTHGKGTESQGGIDAPKGFLGRA